MERVDADGNGEVVAELEAPRYGFGPAVSEEVDLAHSPLGEMVVGADGALFGLGFGAGFIAVEAEVSHFWAGWERELVERGRRGEGFPEGVEMNSIEM